MVHRSVLALDLACAAALALAAVAGCRGATDDGAIDGGGRGSDGAACSAGSVAFTLGASTPSDYCVGAASTCSSEWLTVVDPAGHALAIDRPCVASCGACDPVACPALCAAPTRLTSSGVQHTWDGTHFAPSTCGAGTACVDRTCAAPGRYVARMCVYRDTQAKGGFCAPEATPTCTEVAFDWPPAGGTGTVRGVLGDPLDAGGDAAP